MRYYRVAASDAIASNRSRWRGMGGRVGVNGGAVASIERLHIPHLLGGGMPT